ncbi:diaminopimelate epimerase [candidate division KSB1 bacterium]|nr:diaminopimelate epimerase [candidate division KSB1 bacterium]
MDLHFVKYSSHGNDFIVVDNRNHIVEPDRKNLIRNLCGRRTSIGADGIILIGTDRDDFTADFFNPDGLPALMCGNGSRAAVHFARQLEIIGNEGVFWVQDKRHKAKIYNDGSIGVEIHLKSSNITEKVVSYREKDYTGFVCDTGVPHYVFINLPFCREEFREFAKYVRNLPEFSNDGINVDMVTVESAGKMVITTYERGVEGLTLSCGTGAVAAVWAGISEAGVKLPAHVQSAGGCIEVCKADDPNSLWIWGSVSHVYSGIVKDIERLEKVQELLLLP